MRRPLIGVLLATLLVLVAAICTRFDPSQTGLRAEFFGPSAPDRAIRGVSGVMPTTGSVRDAAGETVGQPFSATLAGSLVVLRPGRYWFAVTADASATVFVDAQPVATLAAGSSGRTASGAVDL